MARPVAQPLAGIRPGHVKLARTVNSVQSASFLSGVESCQQALDNPRAFAQDFGSKLVSTLQPLAGLQRTIAQAGIPGLLEADTTIRRPRGVVETLKANTPGLSSSVPPYLDQFGEAVQRTQSPLTVGILKTRAGAHSRGVRVADPREHEAFDTRQRRVVNAARRRHRQWWDDGVPGWQLFQEVLDRLAAIQESVRPFCVCCRQLEEDVGAEPRRSEVAAIQGDGRFADDLRPGGRTCIQELAPVSRSSSISFGSTSCTSRS